MVTIPESWNSEDLFLTHAIFPVRVSEGAVLHFQWLQKQEKGNVATPPTKKQTNKKTGSKSSTRK